MFLFQRYLCSGKCALELVEPCLQLNFHLLWAITDFKSFNSTLAIQMQADMDKKNQTRRQYTEDILWQHYYQKVRNGAKSHTNSATFAPSFPGNPATQHRDEREVPMAQEPTSQSATGIEGHIGEKGRSALRNSPLSAEEFTMDPSPSSAAEVDSSSKNPLTTSSLVPRINTFVEGSSDTSTHQSLPIPHTSSATLNISPSTTIPLHPSTSNTMASSESQVALGGEDASANNPKRTLEDEADNGELATQNAAKKYKTVKYNLGDVPEYVFLESSLHILLEIMTSKRAP